MHNKQKLYVLHSNILKSKGCVYLYVALQLFHHLSYLELRVLPLVPKLTDFLLNQLFSFQVSCIQ